MFREMRRKRQQMGKEECIRILDEGASGVLAVHGDDGYPYAVPLNYVYTDEKIYFHCAKTGHKTEAIEKNEKVSFCVVGMDQNVPEKFTSYFKSVVIFGKAAVVKDDAEKKTAIEKLAIKYSPDEPKEKRDAAIEREWDQLAVIRVDIEHMSGKQAIELVAAGDQK